MNYFNPAVMRAGAWLSCGEEASLSFRRRLKPLTGVRILPYDIFAAVRRDSLSGVKRLLKAGADVNAENEDGTTPLHLAAESNPTPAVLEVLLKAGADVNAKDEWGWTPPHFAARYNPTPAVLEVLLKAGADPRAIDKSGWTPLHAAATFNPTPAVLEVLLKAGADVNAKDN